MVGRAQLLKPACPASICTSRGIWLCIRPHAAEGNIEVERTSRYGPAQANTSGKIGGQLSFSPRPQRIVTHRYSWELGHWGPFLEPCQTHPVL